MSLAIWCLARESSGCCQPAKTPARPGAKRTPPPAKMQDTFDDDVILYGRQSSRTVLQVTNLLAAAMVIHND